MIKPHTSVCLLNDHLWHNLFFWIDKNKDYSSFVSIRKCFNDTIYEFKKKPRSEFKKAWQYFESLGISNIKETTKKDRVYCIARFTQKDFSYLLLKSPCFKCIY